VLGGYYLFIIMVPGENWYCLALAY